MRIKSATDFLQEVKFIDHTMAECHDDAVPDILPGTLRSQAIPWTDSLQNAFIERFKHYVCGSGHPCDDAITLHLSDDDKQHAANNPAYRAQQLCLFITGSEIPNGGDDSQIKVFNFNFIHHYFELT